MLSRLSKSFLLSILVCITLSANDSGPRLITPDHFDWMAQTSIHIMQAYRNMNDRIDAAQPTILFFYFDMIRPFRSNFQIPTTLGNVSVMPIEGRAYFYFRWPFI